MDINMDLPKNTDLKELNNFYNMEFIQQCLNIIASDIGYVTESDDRFGIFFDNKTCFFKSMSIVVIPFNLSNCLLK
jgi:hypothetical protein